MQHRPLLIALGVAIAAAALPACSVVSGQRTVGAVVDDSTITTRVKTRMAGDERVSAMRIGVETLNGVVQLSGFATSAAEKQAAADLARSVPDVQSVRNDIIVRAPQN